MIDLSSIIFILNFAGISTLIFYSVIITILGPDLFIRVITNDEKS